MLYCLGLRVGTCSHFLVFRFPHKPLETKKKKGTLLCLPLLLLGLVKSARTPMRIRPQSPKPYKRPTVVLQVCSPDHSN